MDSRGYYAILGVSQDANFQEINKSYRKVAKKYHPDRNKSPHAEEIIKKINEAFETLSDRRKRKQYDRESSNIFDLRIRIMKKKKRIYQIKNKRIHINLQSRNPKIILVMITYF